MDINSTYHQNLVRKPRAGSSAIRQGHSFLYLFRFYLFRVLLISAACQLVFFFSVENLFAVICVLIGWKITEFFLLRRMVIERFSLSALIAIGFSLTQFCLPMIFTLFEGKPLIYNLRLPFDVFTHSLIANVILVSAHGLYRYLVPAHSVVKSTLQNQLGRLAFYRPPTNLQLWLIGTIGLLGMVGTYFSEGRYGVTDVDRGAVAKVLQGLIIFAYAPFFIYLRPLFDYKAAGKKQSPVYMVAYTVVLIMLGVVGNTRATFMLALTTVGIAYFFGLLNGKFTYKVFTFRNSVLLGCAFWIVTGPLADLGTAMVVVRSQRTDISGTKLLSRTLDIYQDKHALRIFKQASADNSAEWDEHYFDNIFLARFCNLKYNDEGLRQTEKIGHVDEKMRKYSLDKFWSILPQPFLTVLGVDLDKDEVISSSYGDYLFQRAGGSNALGGFRTGQFASTGMTSFGWWYLLILFIGLFPLFTVVDAFVIYTKRNDKPAISIISLAGLLIIAVAFMFFSLSSQSESVVNIYTYLLRGWIQYIITYAILIFLVRKFSKVIKQFV